MEFILVLRYVKKYCLSILLLAICFLALKKLTGSICFSVIMFGIPCPACGLTRASILLLSGHIQDSLEMHPLLILIIIGLLLYPLLKRVTARYKFFINVYIIITISIFICFYIYRMYIYFPHKEPMIYYKENIIARIIRTIITIKE